MTREDALMAMNGATLIGVADKLGVKAACNKTRTALKEAKANVIARILEAEAALAAQEAPAAEPETQKPAQTAETVTTAAPVEEPEAEETTQETQAEESAAVEKPKAKPAQENLAPAKKEKPKKAQEPAVEPAEVTAAVTALEGIFDKLNDLYFDSLLPKAAIAVRRATRTYDCCSVKKGETEGQYNIEVCAGAIGKPIKETAASLLHAMVHLYCAEMDIAETCQKGRYHNGKFKKECEDRDLIVEYDSANGFVHTLPSEAFAGKLKAAGVDLNMALAAIPAKKKGPERA